MAGLYLLKTGLTPFLLADLMRRESSSKSPIVADRNNFLIGLEIKAACLFKHFKQGRKSRVERLRDQGWTSFVLASDNWLLFSS